MCFVLEELLGQRGGRAATEGARQEVGRLRLNGRRLMIERRDAALRQHV